MSSKSYHRLRIDESPFSAEYEFALLVHPHRYLVILTPPSTTSWLQILLPYVIVTLLLRY